MRRQRGTTYRNGNDSNRPKSQDVHLDVLWLMDSGLLERVGDGRCCSILLSHTGYKEII